MPNLSPLSRKGPDRASEARRKAIECAAADAAANRALDAFLEGYEGRERQLRRLAWIRVGHHAIQQESGPLTLVCYLHAVIGRTAPLITRISPKDEAHALFKTGRAAA